MLLIEGSSNCPPGVRTALGLCFYNLSDLVSARICFQRRLALKGHPPCSFSLVALATIEKELNPDSDEYLSYLKTAYSHTKSNSLVLNALAEYFFKKEDYQKVSVFIITSFILTRQRHLL